MHAMFIAALFAIAKIWEQPKCPSVDEWIKRQRYSYTMAYYSDVKKKEILPFVTTWMGLEYYAKPVRERQIPYDFMCNLMNKKINMDV